MATAVSFGQITITDITDVGSLSCYPSADKPISVIYNPDQNSFTPNWGSTNLNITPNIYYAGTQLTASSTGVTITWTRQEGTAAPTALTTGEAKQSDGSLKVSANKFTANSTMITYILTVDYIEPESSAALRAEGRITFSLVKQASAVRTAVITGDSVFKYNTSQTLVGSDTITLTATVNNVSITAWQYLNSSGTWTKYPSSGTGTSLAVKATDSTFVNEKCQIKLVTSDANVYDIHVITKLYDGAPGTSTIAAVLTNEDQMIPCNSSGTPNTGAFNDAVTQLLIYRGGTVETSGWSTTITPSSGVTFQTSADGAAWSANKTTAETMTGSAVYARVTALSTDTGKLTFASTKSGETALNKEFTVVKIKAGTNGAAAVVYDIEPVTVVVNKAISGALTPSSVVVNAYSKTGSNNRAAYSGRFKFFAGDTSGTAIYTSGSNESSHTLTSTEMANAISAGYITCCLYAAGGTTTLLDTQTIAITSDGQTGGQGPQGNPGSDAYNVTLGNYADVLACTSSNTLSAATTITIPFTGWKGTSRVACTASAPALLGKTATITNATASASGKIEYALTAGTSVANASGTITISFTIGGTTVTADYRWTRSTAAVNGTNAVILQIQTPKGTVFNNGSGTLDLTGVLMNGASQQTSGVTYQWAKYNGTTYANISGATSATYTVNGTDVDGMASYRLTATYSSKPYIAYVSVIDKSDPLQCEVFSSIGDQIMNGTGVGAFYVIVTRNGVEIDPLKSNRFLTVAPSTATTGDYYYHLDAIEKTATLKKYSGSAWADAPSGDLPTGTYTWTHMDKDGVPIENGPAVVGKVIYIDGTLFDKKMVSNVQVTI